MTTVNDLFPSRFLKAEDFTEGESQIVTVKSWQIEKLGRKGEKEEDKPVLYFSELDKGLVLNKTNAKIVSEMHGDELEGWVGKTITLFVMEVDSFGDIVQAIRVKPKSKTKPAAAKPVTTAPPNGKLCNVRDGAAFDVLVKYVVDAGMHEANDPTSRMRLQKVLGAAGFTVFTAASIEEAKRIVTEHYAEKVAA